VINAAGMAFLMKRLLGFFMERPEDEDGFIYRYTEYDYDPLGKSKTIHVHKYDPKVIDEQVKIALENQKAI
jgi:hypothetical protein